MKTIWANSTISHGSQQIHKEYPNFQDLDPAVQAAIILDRTYLGSFQEIRDLATLLHSHMGTCPDRP